MIGLRTKREVACPSVNYGGLTALLNLAIKSSLWNETSKPKLRETLRLLELLKTAIRVRLGTLER